MTNKFATALGIAFLLSIITFQNCSNSGSKSFSSRPLPLETGKVIKSDLLSDLQVLEYHLSPETLYGDLIYRFDLVAKTLYFEKKCAPGVSCPLPSTRNLTTAEFDSLAVTIKSLSLCSFSPPPGTVTCMAIGPEYAFLKYPSTTLSAQKIMCSRGVDFCGIGGETLKNYILSTYESVTID